MCQVSSCVFLSLGVIDKFIIFFEIFENQIQILINEKLHN